METESLTTARNTSRSPRPAMAKSTTRSKKSSSGVTRRPPSACGSPMRMTSSSLPKRTSSRFLTRANPLHMPESDSGHGPKGSNERDLLTDVAVQDRSEPVHFFLQGLSRWPAGLFEPRDADLLAVEPPGPGHHAAGHHDRR